MGIYIKSKGKFKKNLCKLIDKAIQTFSDSYISI